ncbi:cadherin-4-like [Lampetra planeri]
MRRCFLPRVALLHLQLVLATAWTADRVQQDDARYAPVKGGHAFQEWSSYGDIQRRNNNFQAFFTKILRREKRQFVIPSIKIPENDAGPFPKHFTTLRATGKSKPVQFNVTGPGMEQTPDGFLSYNPNTGYLYVTRPIDREKTPRVQLEYFVYNDQGTLLEGPKRLTIDILDMNDNVPEFASHIFNATIPENAAYGVSVLQVSAVDRDDPSTPNGRLVHSIVSQTPGVPFAKLFTINGTTGVISTAFGLFDRELVDSYTLTVQATDLGGRAGALSASATVSVTISDVNDNPPVCQHPQVYGEVKENTTDLNVTTLSVTDRDEKFTPNWRAVYKIQNGKTEAHVAIKTDPQTNQGIVSIIKPVHYRDTKAIVLNVSVENEVAFLGSDTRSLAGPTGLSRAQDPLWSVPGRRLCQLMIRVLEEELAPVFVPPHVEVTVEDGARPGARVTILTATDPNSSASRIEYSILDDEANWLHVDRSSGEVTTRATLDRNSTFVRNSTYTVFVTAIKHGAATKTATCSLAVRLDSPAARPLLTLPPKLAKQRGLNVGAMAAVICSLVALALAALLLLLCRRSRKKSQPSEYLISKMEAEGSLIKYNEDGGEEKPYSLRLVDMTKTKGDEVSRENTSRDQEDPPRDTTESSLFLQNLSPRTDGETENDCSIKTNSAAQSFGTLSEEGSIFQTADLDVDLTSIELESLPRSCQELETQSRVPAAMPSVPPGGMLLRSKNFQNIHVASDVTTSGDGGLAAQRFSKSMHSFSDARASEFASSELLLDQDMFAQEHSDLERYQSDDHGMSESTDVSLDCDWPEDNGSESVTLDTPQPAANPMLRAFEQLNSGQLQECFSILLGTEKELADMDPLAQANDMLLSYRYEGDGSRADNLSCCSSSHGDRGCRSAQPPASTARP